MRKRKEIISWAFYDWANSAYSTTVMAGFFPLFFEKFWSNPEDVIQSTYQLGIANSISSVVIALLAPVLGAFADRGSLKKKLLITFAFLGSIMTGALWFVGKGNWELAVFFYVMATIGFMAGNVFYDSLLPAVAKRSEFDYVSSLGYSLGYLGGGLLFMVNVFMYLYYVNAGLGLLEAACHVLARAVELRGLGRSERHASYLLYPAAGPLVGVAFIILGQAGKDLRLHR